MKIAQSISDLPAKPVVYGLFGGTGKNAYVAYVGSTRYLKNRISQHLIRRDSSVTSGTTAASLNPDFVTEVHWWRASGFYNKVKREAAEIVALQMLEPTLRSRSRLTGSAQELADDPEFRTKMEELFKDPPEGKLILPDLQSALDRIEQLEEKVERLETRLNKKPKQ